MRVMGVQVRHETVSAGCAVGAALDVHEKGRADELAECGALGNSAQLSYLVELFAAFGVEFKVEGGSFVSASGSVLLVGHP